MNKNFRSLEKGLYSLRVTKITPDYVNNGIAEINVEDMKEIGVRPIADYVQIIGNNRKTVAQVFPSPPERPRGLIGIDGATRSNAGVSYDDRVFVRKADVLEAESVTLIPRSEYTLSKEYLKEYKIKKYRGAIAKGDTLWIPQPLGKAPFGFEVKDIKPNVDGVIITQQTVIEYLRPKSGPGTGVTYEDIGGLHEELERVRELIELPLMHPEVYRTVGICPPRGVLLYGPPGCGKTLIAKAISTETNANFLSISGAEIHSKYYGESEARVREIFEQAKQNRPCIIFIDELDVMAPKREAVYGEVEKRVVAQLLSLMDGLGSVEGIVVIGATNRPEALDLALRRPGRLDREIKIPPPNTQGRYEIFRIHTRAMPLSLDVDLNQLANITHGFTGADIEGACREAAMAAIRRVLPEIDLTSPQPVSYEILSKIVITHEDLLKAVSYTTPTGMREVIVEVPNVRWDDVGGLEEAKRNLQELLQWPLKYPTLYKKYNILPHNVLLIGPPGCGKTLIAKAVATEAGINFISVKGPELYHKYVGESEENVRKVFERAKQVAPCIIFFDQIESLAPRRGTDLSTHVTDKVTSQLATEMDGIEALKLKDVCVIGATNRPDLLEPDLLRPGRFDEIIYIGPPDEKARYEIFKIHTRGLPLSKDVDLNDLAKRTEKYSGADIEFVCRKALRLALREHIEKYGEKAEEYELEINSKHFEDALKLIIPRVDYEEYKAYFSRFLPKKLIRE